MLSLELYIPGLLTQGEYTKPAEVLNQETGFVAPRGLGGATTFTDDTIPVYSMCMQIKGKSVISNTEPCVT